MERTVFSCSVIDDLIGTESGVSMTTSDSEEACYEANKPLNKHTGRRSRSSTAVRRQYPPPMNRSPWVLKREYCDGRLIVKEERERRRQHLEIHRGNGRLVVTLLVSEQEDHQKVEVREEGEEEGTDVTRDELENIERSPLSVVCYGGCMETGLKVPMASWIVRDPPPSRPIATAM